MLNWGFSKRFKALFQVLCTQFRQQTLFEAAVQLKVPMQSINSCLQLYRIKKDTVPAFTNEVLP